MIYLSGGFDKGTMSSLPATTAPPLLALFQELRLKKKTEVCVMANATAFKKLQRATVHRHVVEQVAAFLNLPQRACARRATKTLWEAVRTASMEDLLCAVVFERHDAIVEDTQLVVVAMSRVPGPSRDSLVAWVGGLSVLYDELQLRFPHAAAIGISARLAAIRPHSIREWMVRCDNVRRDCCCVGSSNVRRRVHCDGGAQP